MERFIPPGYVAIEQAIVRLARAKHSAIWNSIPVAEQLVWDRTLLSHQGQNFVGEMNQHLAKHQSEAADAMRRRYLNFVAASFDLRRRLGEKGITAYSFDQEYRFGRVRHEVWLPVDESDTKVAGVFSLLQTGFNRRTGRWLFLFLEDVEALEKVLQNEARQEGKKSGFRGRDLRYAERVLRASHVDGSLWPNLQVLWEEIKAIPQCANLKRHEIDSLRKRIDSSAVRPRGRPRKSPAQ